MLLKSKNIIINLYFQVENKNIYTIEPTAFEATLRIFFAALNATLGLVFGSKIF